MPVLPRFSCMSCVELMLAKEAIIISYISDACMIQKPRKTSVRQGKVLCAKPLNRQKIQLAGQTFFYIFVQSQTLNNTEMSKS